MNQTTADAYLNVVVSHPRWSKYDKHRAEQEAAVSPDTASEPEEEDPPEDNA